MNALQSQRDKSVMRTGKELILATKPFARESVARSWYEVIIMLLLIPLTLTVTVAAVPVIVRLGFSLLGGLLMLRLFIIYHDQQHGTILGKSYLASVIMRLVGCLLLSPSSIWKSSHTHHHNHNSKVRGSDIGSFPVMTKAQYGRSSYGERTAYLFKRHPLTILFGYIFVFLYGMCLNPFLSKPSKHIDCLSAMLIHAAIAAMLFLAFGWQAWLFAQFLPSLVSSAIGSYLFYAQHNFPEVEFFDRAGWTYEKAAMQSSSHLKTGALMAWFTGNIGYHHIHHLNAHIPFYRLPEAYARIPELRRAKTISLHPSDILRCLRLKVWDTDTQRMVALR